MTTKGGSSVRLVTAQLGGLPNVTVPTAYHGPPIPQKRVSNPEPGSDVIRRVTKMNGDMAKTVTMLNDQCNVMSERIEYIQTTLTHNKETIGSLRSRIAQLSFTGETAPESDAAKTVNEITPNTVVDFLQNKPVILEAFLSNSFQAFCELSTVLDKDTLPRFVDYSVKQLERVSLCFEVFNVLVINAKENAFLETICDCAKQVFNSTTCYMFVKDDKTGDLGCFFDAKDMLISLKGQVSIVANAWKQQKVVCHADPRNTKMYSQSLDPLFNPLNKPVILVPIGSEAIMYVIHTDPTTFSFTNEDRVIGELFSVLCRPLMVQHLSHKKVETRIENREVFGRFQMELEKRAWYLDIIPFLEGGLAENTGARDVSLFLVDDKELFHYQVVENMLTRRAYGSEGIVKAACDDARYSVVAKLTSATAPAYSEEMDNGWFEKSCAVFPVHKNGALVGAIVVANKKGGHGFGEWDIEFMCLTCAVLANVLPRCRKNEENAAKVQAIKDMEDMTESLRSMNASSLEADCQDPDAIVRNVVDRAHQIMKGEYLTVFYNGMESHMSVHNGEVYEDDVVPRTFIERLLAEKDWVNCPDRLQIRDYEGVESTTFVAAKKRNIAIIAVNATTRFGRFDDLHGEILMCFCSALGNALHVNRLKHQIRDDASGNDAVQNVVRACEIAASMKADFEGFMGEVCRFVSMRQFCVLQHVKLIQRYNTIAMSGSFIDWSISSEDPLMVKFLEMKEVFSMPVADVEASSIKEVFKDFEYIAVVPADDLATVLVLAGNQPPPSYSLFLSSIAPMFSVFVSNYILRSRPRALEIAAMNDIELVERVYDAVIDSCDFVSSELSPSQQIEAVIKLFSKLNLLDGLEINALQLAEAVKLIGDSYHNIPYHNWCHAINVTQFLYFLVTKNKLTNEFPAIELAALLFAALTHDVGHTGISSETMEKYNMAMSFIYGIQSPLERKHAQDGSVLLMKSDFAEKIDNGRFWEVFSAAVLATDVTLHAETSRRFTDISGDFDPSNDSHRLILGQLLILIANVSNCWRPSDAYRGMCACLASEKRNERAYIKKLTQNDDPPAPEPPASERETQFLTDVVSPLASTFDHFRDASGLSGLLAPVIEKWNTE